MIEDRKTQGGDDAKEFVLGLDMRIGRKLSIVKIQAVQKSGVPVPCLQFQREHIGQSTLF